jgi:Domain of unknown function (DUF1844)
MEAMMTDKKSEQDEVKVTDKRRFTEDGDVRDPNEPDVKADETVEGTADKGQAKAEPTSAVPDIDFPTFVLSLATSAQVHLGAIPNPATGKQDADPNLAKQTIDILGVLEEKTKGNLTEQEAKLMDHLLYDLRMMYMQLDKKA